MKRAAFGAICPAAKGVSKGLYYRQRPCSTASAGWTAPSGFWIAASVPLCCQSPNLGPWVKRKKTIVGCSSICRRRKLAKLTRCWRRQSGREAERRKASRPSTSCWWRNYSPSRYYYRPTSWLRWPSRPAAAIPARLPSRCPVAKKKREFQISNFFPAFLFESIALQQK